MKDLFTDASKSGLPFCVLLVLKSLTLSLLDFPRTMDQRVYHVGIRAGEVANRIVSYQLGRRPADATDDI